VRKEREQLKPCSKEAMGVGNDVTKQEDLLPDEVYDRMIKEEEESTNMLVPILIELFW
jgi:hypothetical protein